MVSSAGWTLSGFKVGKRLQNTCSGEDTHSGETLLCEHRSMSYVSQHHKNNYSSIALTGKRLHSPRLYPAESIRSTLIHIVRGEKTHTAGSETVNWSVCVRGHVYQLSSRPHTAFVLTTEPWLCSSFKHRSTLATLREDSFKPFPSVRAKRGVFFPFDSWHKNAAVPDNSLTGFAFMWNGQRNYQLI